MMKYCTHCGKQLFDEAVICVGCGCAVSDPNIIAAKNLFGDSTALLNALSQRVNTSGIIWLVIGVLQILGGLFLNWFLLIVGILNIISSVQDMQYSKTLQENPMGIVAKYEPLTVPIIALVYNLVFGGIIGVVGSIYYFVQIRGFVIENKEVFSAMATTQQD